MQLEIWLPVPGFEEYYEASSLGRIRRIAPARRTKVGRILDGSRNNSGYLTVGLYRGSSKQFKLGAHVIIARTFIPNPDNLPQVNHRNGIKTDNRPENLEWVDRRGNAIHAYDIGLRGATKATKLTDQQVRDIRRMRAAGFTLDALGKAFGVNFSYVGEIVRGEKRQRAGV